MRLLRNRLALCLLVCLVGLPGIPAQVVGAALRYSVIDIGTVPNGKSSYANGINQSGQVVGSVRDENEESHAFIWSPTRGLKVISTDWSIGMAINDAGQVAGIISNGTAHPVVWDPKAGQIDLDPTSQAFIAFTNGINNLGQVVGTEFVSPHARAFIWDKKTGFQDFGALVKQSNTTPQDINDLGQVVGQVIDENQRPRAFLW